MQLFEEAAPGRNRWILLDPPEKLKHLPASVEFMTPEDFERQDLTNDIIFIHMLQRAERRVVFATEGARFIWIAWGGDFYGDILGQALLGPQTRKLAPPPRLSRWEKMRIAARRAAFERLPQPIIRSLIRRFPKSFFSVAKEASTAAVIRRCYGVIFVLPIEADLVRKRFPGLHFRTFSWNYTAFSSRRDLPDIPTRSTDQSVLIGNSGFPGSNHSECLELLRSVDVGLDVYLPVSYGRGKYLERLKGQMPSYPQHRLHMLEEFLPLDEYERIVGRCCYVIMGHKRQQAMGNIVYALAIGARVYLDRESPVYRHFVAHGAVIFALEDFPLHAQERAGWLDIRSERRNREVVRNLYGWTAALAKTRALTEALAEEAGMPEGEVGTRNGTFDTSDGRRPHG